MVEVVDWVDCYVWCIGIMYVCYGDGFFCIDYVVVDGDYVVLVYVLGYFVFVFVGCGVGVVFDVVFVVIDEFYVCYVDFFVFM